LLIAENVEPKGTEVSINNEDNSDKITEEKLSNV